jgi:hypothetical protein
MACAVTRRRFPVGASPTATAAILLAIGVGFWAVAERPPTNTAAKPPAVTVAARGSAIRLQRHSERLPVGMTSQ